MLKRILPFLLTLIVGLVLGGFLRQGRAGFVSETQEGPVQVTPGVLVTEKSTSYVMTTRVNERSSLRVADRRVQVLRRVEPVYTEEARGHRVSGTVVLRALFSSTGRVTDVSVLRGLPDGLTKQAIAAARQIEFMPAIKDGRPVSQYIQIEYNFNLY
ncbi:MAG TPA: energy transducer TonB [Pyrinomonadaceae bacterium]|jgi:TonB family protein